MKRIAFHELAERELNDAALYYEQERAGLGVKFLDEVERVIGSIIQNPHAGKQVLGRVRRRIFRKFPYGILYSVNADGIQDSRHYESKKKATVLGGQILKSCPTQLERTAEKTRPLNRKPLGGRNNMRTIKFLPVQDSSDFKSQVGHL